MICELEFEVRTYDVDFAGIVSNLVYHRWLEDLRLEVLAQAMSVPELMDAGMVPTLAQTLIDFRAPLRLAERVRGRQAITVVGRTSFVFETEMRRVPDGLIIAVARHKVVLVDAGTGQPVPVPARIRALVTRPPFDVRLRGIDDAPSATGLSRATEQGDEAMQRDQR